MFKRRPSSSNELTGLSTLSWKWKRFCCGTLGTAISAFNPTKSLLSAVQIVNLRTASCLKRRASFGPKKLTLSSSFTRICANCPRFTADKNISDSSSWLTTRPRATLAIISKGIIYSAASSTGPFRTEKTPTSSGSADGSKDWPHRSNKIQCDSKFW